MAVEWLLLRMELVVAALAVLGALKSAYNGWISDHVLGPLDQIQEVADRTERLEETQEEMADQQEVLTDAVIALGSSHGQPDREFDVDTFRQEVDRTDGSENLLDD